MATNGNDTVTMIEVPVTRGKNGVDLKATLANAENVAREYAKQDEAATKAVVTVTAKILTDDRHAKVPCFTSGVIAKMVLGVLGEIPTDKLCAETEERVKAFLSGQPEKYLHIKAGRNSGFHIIDRYKKEDLAKLQKTKTAEETAAAASAAK